MTKAEELKQVQAEYQEYYRKGITVDGATGERIFDAEKAGITVPEFKERMEKIAVLEQEVTFQAKAAQMARQAELAQGKLPEPEPDEPVQAQAKSLGELFTDSDAYKDAKQSRFQKRSDYKLEGKDFDKSGMTMSGIIGGFKTTMTTSAGIAAPVVDTGRVIPTLREQNFVQNYITQIVAQDAIKYYRESTVTNNAAERAENAAAAESALATTGVSISWHDISHYIPVTAEQLEDVRTAQAYVNGRLITGLQERLSTQILVGDGSGANITGIKNVSGVLTFDGATLPEVNKMDVIIKAKVKVETQAAVYGGTAAMCDIVCMSPTDWQGMVIAKDTTGRYLWGDPNAVGPNAMRAIWGITVLTNASMATNAGIIGDFNTFAELYVKQGISVATDYINDDFIKRKSTILAYMRCDLAVLRPAAFCYITNFDLA